MADNEGTTPEVTGPVNEGATPPLVTDAPTPTKKRGQKIVDEVKRVEGAIIEDAKKVGELIKEEIKTLEDAVKGAAETEGKALEDNAKAEVKTTVEDFIKEEVHKVVEEIQAKLPDIPTLQDILWKQHGVKVN